MPVMFATNSHHAARSPVANHCDHMSTATQFFDGLWRKPVLCLDGGRLEGPGVEARWQVVGVEVRRVDGFLQVVAVMDMPQEHGQGPLVLRVATRRAKREIRCAVAKCEGRAECRARTNTWLQSRREPLLQPVHLGACAKTKSEGGDRG